MTGERRANLSRGKQLLGSVALRAKSEAAAELAVELSEAMLSTSPSEFEEQVRTFAGSFGEAGMSIFDDDGRGRLVVEICRSLVRTYAGRVKSAGTARAGTWLVEALTVEKRANSTAESVATRVDPSVEPGAEDAPAPEPAPATPGNGAGVPS